MSIVIENVSKRFDQVQALKDVSCTLEAVSYTHLDVYKRQGWRFFNSSAPRR